MNSYKGFKRGWYGESYRHYLSAKGIKSGSKMFFAERQTTLSDSTRSAPDLQTTAMGRKKKAEELTGKTAEAIKEDLKQMRPEAQRLKDVAEGGAQIGEGYLRQAAEARRAAAEAEYLKQQKERESLKQTEISSRPGRIALQEAMGRFEDEDRWKKADLSQRVLASLEEKVPGFAKAEVTLAGLGPAMKAKLAGIRAKGQLTQEDKAIVAEVGSLLAQEASLTGRRPTSEERATLGKTPEGRAALRAADNSADVYERLQEAGTLTGQAKTALAQTAVGAVAKSLQEDTYEEFVKRKAREDSVEAQLAQRLSPGFPNPVISNTADSPFKGSLNPFTDDDVETPILQRFDRLLGKPLVTDPQSRKGVEVQIEEVTKSSGDWAKTSVVPYADGLSAVKMKQREPLVNSIIELEKEAKVLARKRQVVDELRQKALSQDNVQNSLVKEGGDNAFALFGSTGATKLDKQIRRIEEVDAKLRKSQNAVQGRIDDLKIKYAGLRSDPQVSVFSMRGVLDGVENKAPSYLGDRVKYFGEPKTATTTLLNVDNPTPSPVKFAEDFLKGNQG